MLEFFDRGHVSFEVALEQVIVGNDDSLDEIVVDLVFAVRHRLRDLGFFGMP